MSEDRPARPSDIARAALDAARAASAARPQPTRRRIAGPRRKWTGAGPGADDPQPLGRLVDSLVTEQDWSQHTKVGSVFGRWEALVGPEIAAHCRAADPHRGRAARRRRVHGLGHPAAADGAVDPGQAARAGGRGRRDPVARCRSDGPELEEGPALRARPGPARHLRLSRPSVPGHRTAGRPRRATSMSTPADGAGPGEPEDGGWREPAGWERRRPGRCAPAPPADRAGSPAPADAVAGSGGRAGSVARGLHATRATSSGAQGWALQHGWSISDGTGPQDAVLAELRGLGARAGRPRSTGRPACCAAAPAPRAGRLRRRLPGRPRPGMPQWAVTAAPLLAAVPALPALPRPVLAAPDRRAAARWPAGTRRSTRAGCCSPPRTRRSCAALVQDPAVQGCCWAATTATSSGPAAGHSPRPARRAPAALIEHHARLLTAVVARPPAGYSGLTAARPAGACSTWNSPPA